MVADLTRANTLPSWCIIHKRFNLSQADFSKRWCLGDVSDVLAQVSSDGTGLPTLCVHVPKYCDSESQCQPSLLLWRSLLRFDIITTTKWQQERRGVG